MTDKHTNIHGPYVNYSRIVGNSSSQTPKECGKCNGKILGSVRSIKCDFCEKHFHQGCTDINRGAFDYVTKNRNRVNWSCECTPEAAETLRSFHQMSKRVDDLERDILKKKLQIKETSGSELKKDGHKS